METAPPEATLRSLGLTEYEVKAWMTLLRHGTLTAERISELGSIPLPRVYDTIAELQKKGFVLVSKGRPKIFKSVEASRALPHFLDMQRKLNDEKLAVLRQTADKIASSLADITQIPNQESRSAIWSVEKRANVSQTLIDQESAARKDIIVFSGDLSWIAERAANIRAVIRRGVKVRAIMRALNTAEAKQNAAIARKIGIKLAIGYTGQLRGHVIDGRTASIATKSPMETSGKPGSDTEHTYELLIFDNPILVDAFKENFEFWWARLKGK
jgi:sugar-specific transcriptional regulator TrmB